MHRSVLSVAALTAAMWAGACSSPTPEPEQAGVGPDTRKIELVTAPAAAAPHASDLEAGRASTPVPTPVVEQRLARAPRQVSADARVSHDHIVAPAAVMVGSTSSTMLDASTTLATAPMPIRMLEPVAAAAVGGPSAADEPVHHHPEAGPGRGPTIIIRGGMGSIHDDCKIHPGGRGPGLAINRMAPSFGGGEIRGSNPGRFPRGGIR
jgi:hypothetical protein